MADTESQIPSFLLTHNELDQTHPELDDVLEDYQVIDDVESKKTIQAAGERHLPRAAGEDPQDYRRRLIQAPFEPVVPRTRTEFVGRLWRKPPTIVLPADEPISAILTNADGDGRPLEGVGRDVTREVLKYGRSIILVSLRNQGEGRPLPMLVRYDARQLRDWEVEDGRVVYAVFAEWRRDPRERHKYIERRRVLRLTDAGLIVQVYERERRDSRAWLFVEELRPLRLGSPLDIVPLVVIGTTGVSLDVTPPPLLPIAEMNLSHYRTGADHEHALYMIGCPQIYITGHQDAGPFRIGPNVVWMIPNENAKVGMNEFRGEGLGAYEKAMDRKRQAMAMLGARLLEPQPSRPETATAIRLRSRGESSALAEIGAGISQGLTRAAQIGYWWSRRDIDAPIETPDVRIELTRDFFDEPLSSDEIKSLVFAHQAGLMSKSAVVDNFQKGEWLPDGRTVDEELRAILTEEDGPLITRSDRPGNDDD